MLKLTAQHTGADNSSDLLPASCHLTTSDTANFHWTCYVRLTASCGRLLWTYLSTLIAMAAAAWYHRDISRVHAEDLLARAGRDGSYLVRDSESVPGAYALCLLWVHTHTQFYYLFSFFICLISWLPPPWQYWMNDSVMKTWMNNSCPVWGETESSSTSCETMLNYLIFWKCHILAERFGNYS